MTMPEYPPATLDRIHSLERQVKKLTELVEVMSRFENTDESLTDTQLNDDAPHKEHAATAVADADDVHYATLGRLTLGIAHDVNNLLNMIVGYSELMLEGMAEEDPRRNFAQAAAELGQQAGEMLHYLTGRADHRAAYAGERVVVSELFEKLQRLLPRFVGGQHRLEVECLTGAQSIPLERMQAIRLLLNLVGNARAATPPGGQIKVTALRKGVQRSRLGYPDAVPVGQYAMLKVSDSGAGMTDDVLRNMFEMRYTTHAESGSGLGLGVVRGIVRDAGGYIQVESAPGSGTQMRIFLPV
jgi:two-component system cell cycle sensor histidine kinase/response regulator CckA